MSTHMHAGSCMRHAIYIRTLYSCFILLYMIITESVYYYFHKKIVTFVQPYTSYFTLCGGLIFYIDFFNIEMYKEGGLF
jgi:hypothetical protein